ncbi:MAG: phenylalanine--tRNA ligase subunit beta [Patescibacteria group bacterium]|nr:phenylalanine--tRNA ligase subunit beta [Patescibacteria group bacterium]
MKFSYNWLKELSGTKKSVDELAELFMTHSFEVEGVEDLSDGLDNVVIGEVMTKEKHPDADKLNVATVTVGDEELQIVCGAPNLEVGQKVPVALVGAVLPDGDDGFEIKKSEIRGVESNGMICAEDELGVGADHDGIMVLSKDAIVGESFVKYAGLDDFIIDIDILPNRGHDGLSYVGIANEICVLEDSVKSHTKPNPLPEGEGDLHVAIDTDKCSRYVGITIDNIEIKESPDWMQARLKASDIQPINNIVDITNYVMLETGQPLHAFNAENITQIGVRQASDGEKLSLLDDTELELDSKDVVITDGDKSIALAGVMGGGSSAITDETKNIILEAASFDATAIRFTQRKYNLQTDAAYRFERNIDPNLAEIAAARAAELLT